MMNYKENLQKHINYQKHKLLKLIKLNKVFLLLNKKLKVKLVKKVKNYKNFIILQLPHKLLKLKH